MLRIAPSSSPIEPPDADSSVEVLGFAEWLWNGRFDPSWRIVLWTQFAESVTPEGRKDRRPQPTHDFASPTEAARAWPKLEAQVAPLNLYWTTAAMVGDFRERGVQRTAEAKKQAGKRPSNPRFIRGGALDVAALPSLALDLDTLGGAHAEQDLPTQEVVLEVLRAMPCPPSAVLASGGGLYAHFALDEPWVLHDEDERERAKEALLRLRDGIRALLAQRVPLPELEEGEKHPRERKLGVEGHDLPRILRPVGGMNQKYGRRVRLLEGGQPDSPRYSVEELEAMLDELPQAEAAVAGTSASASASRSRPKKARPSRFAGPATWVLALGRELGTIDEGPHFLRLRTCPYCSGGTNRDEGTAWLIPSSGRLKCWRDHCTAGQEIGVPPSVWMPKAETVFGTLPPGSWERWSKRRDLEERPKLEAEERATTAPLESWPEIDLEGDGLTHELVRWWIEAHGSGSKVQVREAAGGFGKTRALARLMAWAVAECAFIQTPLRGASCVEVDGLSPQQDDLEDWIRPQAEALLRSALIFRDHGDAGAWLEEFRTELERLGVPPGSWPVRYVRGITQDLEDGTPACARKPEWAAGGASAAAVARRALCGSCPHKATCEVVRAPAEHELLVGVRSSLESMASSGMLHGRVVVIDEKPEVAVDVTLASAAVSKLLANAHLYGPRRGRWVREFATGLVAVKAKALQLMEAAAAGTEGGTDRLRAYGGHLGLEAAVMALEPEEGFRFVMNGARLATTTRSSLPTWDKGSGCRSPEDVKHPAEAEALWSACVGLLERWPEDRWPEGWCERPEVVVPDEQGEDRRLPVELPSRRERVLHRFQERQVRPSAWSSSRAFVLLNRAGELEVEVKTPAPWRAAVEPRLQFNPDLGRRGGYEEFTPSGCLILSATARSWAGLVSQAANNGGADELELQVKGVRPKGRSVFGLGRGVVAFDGASRRGMLAGPRARREEVGRSRAAQMLRSALQRQREHAPEVWDEIRQAAGVITYKPLAEILLGLRPEAEEDRQELLAVLEEFGVTLAAAEGRGRYADNGRPAVGWWGKDEAASNAFKKCRLLILLGQPTMNLGAAQRLSEALSVPLEAVTDDQAHEALGQAVLRLRHLRRPDEPLRVLAVLREMPTIDAREWEQLREVQARGVDPELERLVAAVRGGEVMLHEASVSWWLGDISLGRDRSQVLQGEHKSGRHRIRTLIAGTRERLLAEGWEVRKIKRQGRGRPWEVVAPEHLDQGDLEAAFYEDRKKWHLDAQSAEVVPAVQPRARETGRSMASGRSVDMAIDAPSLLELARGLMGDPEAQRHATDAARFLLRDLAIPRLTLSRLKRADEGAEVERIYALAVGLEAEAQGLVEDPAVTVEGTSRGTLRLVRNHKHGRSSAAAVLAWSSAAQAIRSRGAEVPEAEAEPRPG